VCRKSSEPLVHFTFRRFAKRILEAEVELSLVCDVDMTNAISYIEETKVNSILHVGKYANKQDNPQAVRIQFPG
jgi:pyridoxine 5'-phosphate synthase PdxJ